MARDTSPETLARQLAFLWDGQQPYPSGRDSGEILDLVDAIARLIRRERAACAKAVRNAAYVDVIVGYNDKSRQVIAQRCTKSILSRNKP